MTTKEMQKRNGKAQGLSVYRAGEDEYLVESSEGKICYKVTVNNDEVNCPCGDFMRNVRTDLTFKCKHIMAVLNTEGDISQAEIIEKRKPKLDDRFIKNIQGRDFVIYAGLLDLAHQKGLIRLDVDIIQHPTKDNNNEAICKAVAHTRAGDIFSDIGDASVKNTNQAIAQHLLRMASTRAKARALRDLTNIGMTCLEELGELTDVIGEGTNGSSYKGSKQPMKRPEKPVKPEPPKPENKSPNEQVQKPKEPEKADSQAPKMTEAQKRALASLAKRRGLSDQEVNEMSKRLAGVGLEELTSQQASSFIRQIQSSA